MPAHFDTGFSVREPMWHKLGTVLDDYPGSWDQARTLAGLDWEPEEGPVFDLVGISPTGQPLYEPIAGYKKITHSGTKQVLDIAGADYQLITHAAMGEVVEAILETPDAQVRYETAGSLYGGRKVWALAQLGQDMQVTGDPSPTRRYLALMTSHDGSAAMRAIATGVRIVCANTWKRAELDGKASGAVYAFKHTRNWRDRVEEAKWAVRGAYRQMDAYLADANALAAIGCTPAQEQAFIEAFVPLPDDVAVPKRIKHNATVASDALSAILAGPTSQRIRGNAYGLTQAAGEYLDHYRRAKTDDSKMMRSLLNVEPLKRNAARIARQVCA